MGKKEKGEKLLLSKKQLIANIIIILIVTGLAIFTLVKNKVFDNLEPLKNIKVTSLIIIFMTIAFYIFGESFVIYRSFRRINPKMKYLDSVGCYLYAGLGSAITPAKTGHHPFRFYYLERKGNSFAQSLANATQCQIVYTLVQVILYSIMTITCLITKTTVTVFGTTVPLYLVGLIGIGMAKGEDKAKNAAAAAINSPLPNSNLAPGIAFLPGLVNTSH